MLSELLPTTRRALLRRLSVEQATYRIPSVVAAIVRDGDMIWNGSRGFVGDQEPTWDTQYRIGSITKTFIAVLIMRLRDEGRLDLTDPLEKHISGTAVGASSIAQILSHSTPLRAELVGEWWERTRGEGSSELLGKLDRDMVRSTPHHTFHYSNVGFAILGELVSRLRNDSWDTVLREEILRPLEMSRTTLEPVAPHAEGLAVHPWADTVLPEPAEDAGAMAPAGQLWSTIADMGRWLRFIAGDTGGVLHPDTVAEMRAPGAVEDGAQWRTGAGLGLQLSRYQGRRLAGHTGSMPGFLATVMADPEETEGVVFMANTTSGMSGGLITDLLDTLREFEPRIPTPWRPKAELDEHLLKLTGHWYWGVTPYVLRVLADGLLDLSPASGRGRTSRFRPNGDGTWTGLDGYYAGEILRAEWDGENMPRYLNLNTFIFTRIPYDPEAPIPGGVDGWRPLA